MRRKVSAYLLTLLLFLGVNLISPMGLKAETPKEPLEALVIKYEGCTHKVSGMGFVGDDKEAPCHEQIIVMGSNSIIGMRTLPKEGRGWSYDMDKNELTLKEFKGSGIRVEGKDSSTDTLRIVLEGVNEIAGTTSGTPALDVENANLELAGSGTLVVTQEDQEYGGIGVWGGNLHLTQGCRVEVKGLQMGVVISAQNAAGGFLSVDPGCTLWSKVTSKKSADPQYPCMAIMALGLTVGGTVIGEAVPGEEYGNVGIVCSYAYKLGPGITLKYGNKVDSTRLGETEYGTPFWRNTQTTICGSAGAYMEVSGTKATKTTQNQYRIKYQLNGGKNHPANPRTYDGSEDVTIYTPEKSGYSFVGWYRDSKLKKKIELIKKGTQGDVQLYAKWRKL